MYPLLPIIPPSVIVSDLSIRFLEALLGTRLLGIPQALRGHAPCLTTDGHLWYLLDWSMHTTRPPLTHPLLIHYSKLLDLHLEVAHPTALSRRVAKYRSELTAGKTHKKMNHWIKTPSAFTPFSTGIDVARGPVPTNTNNTMPDFPNGWLLRLWRSLTPRMQPPRHHFKPIYSGLHLQIVRLDSRRSIHFHKIFHSLRRWPYPLKRTVSSTKPSKKLPLISERAIHISTAKVLFNHPGSRNLSLKKKRNRGRISRNAQERTKTHNALQQPTKRKKYKEPPPPPPLLSTVFLPFDLSFRSDMCSKDIDPWDIILGGVSKLTMQIVTKPQLCLLSSYQSIWLEYFLSIKYITSNAKYHTFQRGPQY